MLRDVAEHAPQAGAGRMHSPRSRSTARPEFGHPPQLRRALPPPHLIMLPRREPSAGDPSGRAGGKWWWCIPRARVSLGTPHCHAPRVRSPPELQHGTSVRPPLPLLLCMLRAVSVGAESRVIDCAGGGLCGFARERGCHEHAADGRCTPAHSPELGMWRGNLLRAVLAAGRVRVPCVRIPATCGARCERARSTLGGALQFNLRQPPGSVAAQVRRLWRLPVPQRGTAPPALARWWWCQTAHWEWPSCRGRVRTCPGMCTGWVGSMGGLVCAVGRLEAGARARERPRRHLCGADCWCDRGWRGRGWISLVAGLRGVGCMGICFAKSGAPLGAAKWDVTILLVGCADKRSAPSVSKRT